MRLILMRHGKSAYPGGVADHDRPLSERGLRSAALMGGWLRRNGWAPDVALVSTALRAQQTWAGTGLTAAARSLPELYHADPDTMLRAARRTGAGCAMIVGHNPGMAALAGELVDEPPGHSRFFTFPTCATLVAEGGNALGFAVPRDLME